MCWLLGISVLEKREEKVELKGMCEKAETRETAQEGDIDAKAQVFQ